MLTAVPALQGVVINEIHYDAEPKTEAAEFVELLNDGDQPVDLSGWRIDGGIDYLIPDGTSLAPGAFLVIAEDPAVILSKFRVDTPHQYNLGLDNDGEEIRLLDAAGTEVDRVDYGVGFPWPTAARGTGASMELIHPGLDNDLGGSWRSSPGGDPSPGARNAVATASPGAAPPAIRQVKHTPAQPATAQEVLITAKVTDPDGVSKVALSYQLLRPGGYLRLTDPTYRSNWNELPMTDDGSGGDALAGDAVYSVTLPATLQDHRRLIRYRIEVEDRLGNTVQVPYDDDESPNFAYFVYDGVPAWRGAERPGSTRGETFSAELMNNALPIYHLIANSTDVTNSQYNSGFRGTRMKGTLVYDGVVYDHIEFYNRGEASTYVSGKNKWRFKFNRARDFVARDISGKKYRTTWKTMNFNACASPWVDVNRGMAGIDEAVPHRLYQLAGVPSSNTHWVHFRVIDASAEAPRADQYAGDLWGLYLAIEHPDGRFLAEHGYPDGSTYKIQGGNGDKKNQGPTQPDNTSDWTSFWSASANLNTIRWWRANFNLDAFYGFRAINRATGNVDLRDQTNYYMYHHPDGRWHVVPWDLDMMYAPVKHIWSGVIQADRCLDHAAIRLEFRNRCRELIDLLFSDIDRHGGHAAQVVEELSQVVNPSGLPLTMVDVDQFMWSHHPRTQGDHRGPWYQRSKVETTLAVNYTRTIPTPDHEGFQQNVIDYMHDTDTDGFQVSDGDENGYGYNYLSLEASDPEIPDTPTISYVGEDGFPADGLRFRSSEFSGPRGPVSFAAIKWRIGEIENPSTPGYLPGNPWKYEVETVWETPEIPTFDSEIGIPAAALRPGHTYRARVRHKDATRRWSHWSDPVEFVVTAPEVTNYQENLVISEIMYNPAGGPDHEFLELHNTASTPLDLTNLRFTKGVDFDFPAGTMIEPGAYLLVVRNRTAFEEHYGSGHPIAGQWESGDNLNNGGERLKLSFGAGTPIHDFEYAPEAPWPSSPDGRGYSLTLRRPDPSPDHADPANWRASAAVGGSPGTSDHDALDSWLATHGLAPGEELTDLDLDGLVALMEYAFGANPNDPADGQALTAGIRSLTVDAQTGDYLVLQFPRRNGADDVILNAEYSTDLVTWLEAGPVVSFTPTADPAVELVGVRAPVPLDTAPQQFLRLRVVEK